MKSGSTPRVLALWMVLLWCLGCRPYAVLSPRSRPLDEAFYLRTDTVALERVGNCFLVPLSLGVELSRVRPGELIVSYGVLPMNSAGHEKHETKFDFQLLPKRPQNLKSACKETYQLSQDKALKKLAAADAQPQEPSPGRFQGVPEDINRQTEAEQPAAPGRMHLSADRNDVQRGSKEFDLYLIAKFHKSPPLPGDILRLTVSFEDPSISEDGTTTFDLRLVRKAPFYVAFLSGFTVIIGATVAILKLTD